MFTYNNIKIKSDRNNTEYSLTVNGESYTSEYTLSVDNKRDEYVLELVDTHHNYSSDYSDKYTVKGSISSNRNKISFSVDSIANKWGSNGETNSDLIKLDCNVTIKTRDKMPKTIDKYTELRDITTKQVNT